MALNIFAGALNGIKRVEARQALLDQVQQQVADLALQPDLAEETRRSQSGNIKWTLDVKPIEGSERHPEFILRPFRITVHEVMPDGTPGRMILDTIVIGRSHP